MGLQSGPEDDIMVSKEGEMPRKERMYMLSDWNVSLPIFLLVCFLVGLGGFVDASAGGGGLITLPAYALTGLPMHTIFAANKCSSSCGATMSALMFLRKGALQWQVALTAAAFSFLGSALASRVVLILPDRFLKTMVLVMIPVAAVIIFTQSRRGEEDHSEEVPLGRKLPLSALIGLLIGGYDGLIGPGTGTFAIIAFTAVLKFDLRRASGNAKVLNLASNYASLCTFLMAGTVPFALAIPCGVCNVCGAWLGSRFALKKGARFIRPMMLVVMVLLLLKLATDLMIPPK